MHRFFCEKLGEGRAELLGAEAHHLLHVHRVRTGDLVELFDGNGALAIGGVEKLSRQSVTVEIERLERVEKLQKPQVVIAASIAKGERFDWLIGKCTELGVDSIYPVIFEHTVKQPGNPKIMDRWNNIAIQSAKQCKRLFLPKISEPFGLVEAIELIKADFKSVQIFVGSPEVGSESVFDIELRNDVAAVVGPEGGISDDENKLLAESGVKFVRLTDSILRIETAGVCFASVLCCKRDGVRTKSS